MAKIDEQHPIRDGLYIYKQDNSKNWYARFKIDRTWYVKSTKVREKETAIESAMDLLREYQFRAKHNVPISRTKRAKKYLFPKVADLAIQRMRTMQDEGIGKASFDGYIRILNKYHKEFFSKTPIMNIDQDLLREFDSWRMRKLGRNPAKSTILDHNSTFNRVFDEAIGRKYMSANQRPTLDNTGSIGKRRASFTEEEFDQLVDAIQDFTDQARTKKSKMIRELLRDYITVAAYSGVRPGSEMNNILWGDITIGREDKYIPIYINVREGKTIKHTGVRKIVCREKALIAFIRLRQRFPDRKPTDKVFLLSDGTETKQIGKTFTKLLKFTKMQMSSEGNRTLYSLRHSYITWQLKAKVSVQILALQCGTSIRMLEDFYSHVLPEMFTHILTGSQFEETEKTALQLSPSMLENITETANMISSEWEAEFAKRGCI